MEQIRPDRRPEQGVGSRRKILTPAQGLQFFSESLAGELIILFHYNASSK
jgi:hypothetical protein